MQSKINEITVCEVCGSDHLEEVLDLGLHPMCDDLVPVGDSRNCKEYPILIVYCSNCYTAHQKYQIPKAELFPSTYHYRARFTKDVLDGMEVLVNDVIHKIGPVAGKKVLDVGCNDGSLLDFFRDKGGKTFGIEPTGAFLDAQGKGHRVYNNFFSVASAEKFLSENSRPDVITFTNVFAHIENLQEVLNALKILVKDETIIVIENHYLGSVLDKNQFDTFYHEHPRTYSYKSFQHIAENLGLDLLNVSFPSRYGGNIRVILGREKIKTAKDFEILEKESLFKNQFYGMRMKISEWQPRMRDIIQSEVASNGKILAKAFPGRAAILIKLLGLDTSLISAVYEKPGSMKIGHYVPGTKIPIQSDHDLFKILPDKHFMLNFAWHIPQEIKSYLTKHGFEGRIINVFNS